MEGTDFSELGDIQEFQTHSLSSIVVGEMTDEVVLQGENIHDRAHPGIGESLLYVRVWREPIIVTRRRSSMISSSDFGGFRIASSSDLMVVGCMVILT